MLFRHFIVEHRMRTTLDIDSDVLAAAKEIARQQHTSAGNVVSQLLRRGLTGDVAQQLPTQAAAPSTGFEPFPARGVIVTDELIR